MFWVQDRYWPNLYYCHVTIQLSYFLNQTDWVIQCCVMGLPFCQSVTQLGCFCTPYLMGTNPHWGASRRPVYTLEVVCFFFLLNALQNRKTFKDDALAHKHSQCSTLFTVLFLQSVFQLIYMKYMTVTHSIDAWVIKRLTEKFVDNSLALTKDYCRHVSICFNSNLFGYQVHV